MLIALIFVLSMMSLGSWLLGMTLAPACRHSTSQWRAWKMQTIVKNALRDSSPQQPNCLPVRQLRTRVHRVAHVHVFPSLFAHYRKYNHPNSALHAQPHGKARYLPLKYWSKRQYKARTGSFRTYSCLPEVNSRRTRAPFGALVLSTNSQSITNRSSRLAHLKRLAVVERCFLPSPTRVHYSKRATPSPSVASPSESNSDPSGICRKSLGKGDGRQVIQNAPRPFHAAFPPLAYP